MSNSLPQHQIPYLLHDICTLIDESNQELAVTIAHNLNLQRSAQKLIPDVVFPDHADVGEQQIPIIRIKELR